MRDSVLKFDHNCVIEHSINDVNMRWGLFEPPTSLHKDIFSAKSKGKIMNHLPTSMSLHIIEMLPYVAKSR